MRAPGSQGRSPGNESRGSGRLILTWITAVAITLLLWCSPALADIAEAQKLFQTGRYEECARAVEQGIDDDPWAEPWRHLKIKNELATGKYEEAMASLEDALRRFPASIPLHLLGRDIYRFNGREKDASAEMGAIASLLRNGLRRSVDSSGFIAMGRFYVLQGEDARKVLDQCYDVVTKRDPDCIEAYFAIAEMALSKEDYALAAQTLRKAPKAAALDPQFHYLLASALEPDDRAGTAKALAEALKINPRHVDSLLLEADQLIDGERYADAEQVLDRVLKINSHEPRAFAGKAVLAHLRNDGQAEAAARQKALALWATNPEVDYQIGRKLSQKYRFAEGAAYQKQALAMDRDFLPAKIQLCQDLLRLGDESDGWQLADEIFTRDGYNVLAYNLTTLRDRLAGFRTLTGDGLIVRMEGREADLYGDRVLSLLRRARKTFSEKYGVTLKEPVIVEIFPQRKEFAVRTFGLPGADGLLGVCFGRVVTANSPASQGEHPSNWEAVLWHEFCHVVTLNKTRNKMPRWLSEGISVYEEAREDPAWATRLDPRFRAMILGDALTPLSRLSSAFLTSKTPLDLQFAYFESALAVEFLVERFGLSALKGLLDDLGTGMAMSDSLPGRIKMTLKQIDEDFARFARERALKVAPGATWEEPDLPAGADSSVITEWLAKHPKSFPGQRRLAAALVVEEKWTKAREVLEQLRAVYPDYVGPDNAYMLLSAVYRRLSDPAAERKVLEELAMKDGDQIPAYLRLMQLAETAGDWPIVARNAERVLAVNPLIAAPYRGLGRALQVLDDREGALTAYRALALLDDSDPALVHYQLATLLHQAGKPREAKREVLKSLEEAPRFRDAHRLLLELSDPARSPAARAPATSLPKGRP
jgi:tetratricopeptide (TPR) repeat protein